MVPHGARREVPHQHLLLLLLRQQLAMNIQVVKAAGRGARNRLRHGGHVLRVRHSQVLLGVLHSVACCLLALVLVPELLDRMTLLLLNSLDSFDLLSVLLKE